LLELARYVVLNPVRAHVVASAGDCPWSSYRAMTRDDAPPDWLETRAILRRTRTEMKRSRRPTPAEGTRCRRSVTTLAYTCHVSAGLSADNPGIATRPRQQSRPDPAVLVAVRKSLPRTVLIASSQRRSYKRHEYSFRGARGSLLGAIRRDRRDSDGQRLGRLRGVVLPRRDGAVVRPRLAGVVPTLQRIGKSPIMVLVGDCRSQRSWQLRVPRRVYIPGLDVHLSSRPLSE